MLNDAINAGNSEKSNLIKDGIKGTEKLSIIKTAAAAPPESGDSNSAAQEDNGQTESQTEGETQSQAKGETQGQTENRSQKN